MPSLIVQQSGTRIGGPITGRVLIGRLPTNGIVTVDSSVSRMHAWIDVDASGTYFVADNGSLTGTWVNGRAVEKRQDLSDGDVVRVGQTQIVFSTQDDLPPGVAPADLSGQPPLTNVADAGVMFDCPCGAPIWFKSAAIGQSHHCRHCGRTVRIPSIPGSVAETIGGAVIGEPGVSIASGQRAPLTIPRVAAREFREDEHGLAEVGEPVDASAVGAENDLAIADAPLEEASAGITDELPHLPSLFEHRQPFSTAPIADDLPAESVDLGESGESGESDKLVESVGPIGSVEPAGDLAAEVQTCSICHSPITASEAQTTCPACALTFHTDCWNENLGCSAYGCSQVGILQPADTTTASSLDVLPEIATDELTLPPESEEAGAFPWEFAFLGISVVGVLMGALAYGVPAAIGAIGNLIYLAAFSSRGKRRSIAVLALLVCIVGAGLDIYASYILWGRWPPIRRLWR